MRSPKVALLISLALLVVSALAAQLPSAGAQSAGQTNVILIEVDGLEPKDVTPETTPFLWEMAHPNAPGGLIEDNRAGWIWQAPRSVMTAGTAANSTALLTGGYPEQSGIPADEFRHEDGTTLRLEYQGSRAALPDGASQIGEQDTSPSLLSLVSADDTQDRDAAAFVGNPALSALANVDSIPDALKWWPRSPDEEDFTGESPPSPAYCDPPGQMPDNPETPDPDPDFDYRPPCSATDLVTLDHAATALATNGSKVGFTYIHLAELGVIKRRDGDVSISPQTPPTEVQSPDAAQSVPHQLAQTDAAIAQFIARYTNQVRSPVTAAKWPNTFVFVVGSHGYETSTPDKRLPAPDGQVGTSDLEHWVEERGFRYSPHGSMATIHVENDNLAAQRAAVAGLVEDLKPDGTVDQRCEESASAGDTQVGSASCIDELLYVRDEVAPASLPAGTALLSDRHPNWHLDHLNLEDDGSRTTASRRSGELLIVTKPGWGTGAVASLNGEEGDLAPTNVQLPDPYVGISGGPRNRAVAAIVNGPGGSAGVNQVATRRYPVTTAEGATLAEANANPEDDTGATGHERQPENVDFAPTIGALLQVGIDSDQLGGRFLQEAFLRELAFPGIEELEEPPPQQQVDERPRVVVLAPPPPPRAPRPPSTWRYSGLLRNVVAAVGDRKGRVYPDVRRGAKLDYLLLQADFGKPLAAVKLTFYRRTETSAQSSQRRTVVKTLATFKPFTVRRARKAKLTLKVPEVFEPTHVGVVVRRARPLTRAERTRALAGAEDDEDVPAFKAYGARAGGIYRIRKAHRLHTRG
jgi:type I phosphodiesterase/nucleotide pyrophosphatase